MQLITPAYKGAPKQEGDASSYRPIAITSYLSRTWERVVALRLENTLARLCPAQFGYLRGRTADQMTGATRRTIERILGTTPNEGGAHHVAAAISFDCTDAFCKVTPAMVRKGLIRIGVDANTTEVITEWMTDRRQAVKLGGTVTAYELVEAGLPQGSVLGPFLWDVVFDDLNVLLYREAARVLRDVPAGHMFCGSFADDLNMVVGGATPAAAARKLQDWAQQACVWFDTAGIPVSPKSKASFFARTNRPPVPAVLKLFTGINPTREIAITNEGLKILGVHFSNDGTCKKHLQLVQEHLANLCITLGSIAMLAHPHKVRQIYQQQGMTKLRYVRPPPGKWRPHRMLWRRATITTRDPQSTSR